MDQKTLDTLYAIYREHPVVTTDTRTITPGAIYFALKGTNFDGNRFANDALAQGCVAAVVDDPQMATDPRTILVPDVLESLQALATHHRLQLQIPILEITGTNGKTTTKELCAAVLQRKYRVLYTEGNLNNHIGVPRTLLRLTTDHQIAVIETGANHPGEIRDLAAMVQPTAGLITNVGMAHLEGFGSFQGVIDTKCELYQQLRNTGGEVFLHADDEILTERSQGLTRHTYGSPGKAHVQGEAIPGEAFLKLRWRVGEGAWHQTQMQLIGSYNVPNALAAIAVGIRYEVSEQDIEEALAAYRPTNNRSELKRTERNSLIIDAYNANPTSMRAALENFNTLQHPEKRVMLGEMRELGQDTAQAHLDVMMQLSQMQLRSAYLVGSAFQEAAEQFTPSGLDVQTFDDVEALRRHLDGNPIQGSLILIKGSNSTRLYTLPQDL